MEKGASFHDSTLLAIERGEGKSLLSFENVYVDEELRNAEIVLTNVSQISCDGNFVSTFEMKYDDGEVLDLTVTETEFHMNVEWTDYKRRIKEFHSYKAMCSSVIVKIGDLTSPTIA